MTLFEIAVPLAALAYAGVAILWAHRSGQALERRLEAARTRNDHPAE